MCLGESKIDLTHTSAEELLPEWHIFTSVWSMTPSAVTTYTVLIKSCSLYIFLASMLACDDEINCISVWYF